MGTPILSHHPTSDLPVVLRLRQQAHKPEPTIHRVKRSRSKGLSLPTVPLPTGWALRSDRLIALSASPLVALIIYICWQWTAAPVPTIDLSQRTQNQPPAEVSMTSASEPVILPVHAQDNQERVSPAAEVEDNVSEPEVLPILPSEDPHVRQSSHRMNENMEAIRRAECWQEGTRSTTGPMIDPAVIRIQSVESIQPMTGDYQPIDEASQEAYYPVDQR